MAHSMVGTPDYIAPEVISGKPYTQSCDWWGVGCIMFECLAGYAPFHGSDAQAILRCVQRWWTVLHIPLTFSALARDLILKLVCEQEKRLNFAGIKKHGFFKGIEWEHAKSQIAPYEMEPMSIVNRTEWKSQSMHEESASVSEKPRISRANTPISVPNFTFFIPLVKPRLQAKVLKRRKMKEKARFAFKKVVKKTILRNQVIERITNIAENEKNDEGDENEKNDEDDEFEDDSFLKKKVKFESPQISHQHSVSRLSLGTGTTYYNDNDNLDVIIPPKEIARNPSRSACHDQYPLVSPNSVTTTINSLGRIDHITPIIAQKDRSGFNQPSLRQPISTLSLEIKAQNINLQTKRSGHNISAIRNSVAFPHSMNTLHGIECPNRSQTASRNSRQTRSPGEQHIL